MAHAAIREPCSAPEDLRNRLYARWVGVDNAKSAMAVAHRTDVPILACVGANGGGKTLCAVYTVLGTLRGRRWACANPDHLHVHGAGCAARAHLSTEPREVCTCATSWERVPSAADPRVSELRCTVVDPDGGQVEGDRRVLSTVALNDPETGNPSPYYERLSSFIQLLGVEHADVVMDEVTGVASARAHQSLPVQVENLIVQLRRRDARLIWTTPDYGAADVRIRQVTQGVVYCRGFAAVAPPAGSGRVWTESRMFRWSLYDARDFDQFTAGKREKLAPRSQQWFWRPGHVAQHAYSTHAAVTQLGAAAEGGMCFTCGGSRSRPACHCPTDPDRLPPGVVEEQTPAGRRVRRRADSPAPVAAGARSPRGDR